jgi:hypothetical protein
MSSYGRRVAAAPKNAAAVAAGDWRKNGVDLILLRRTELMRVSQDRVQFVEPCKGSSHCVAHTNIANIGISRAASFSAGRNPASRSSRNRRRAAAFYTLNNPGTAPPAVFA